MTPEERRELAERLVERAAELNERSAKVMGSLGRGWANAAADLRAAAAALREDAAADLRAAAAALREYADTNLIGVEDVVAVHGRDALADTIRERDAARAEVERLRACEAERERGELRERLADAVVIPRSAIPDGLVEHLWLLDGFLSEDRNWDGSALRRYLRLAARLLSGGATEGRTCWPEEGT